MIEGNLIAVSPLRPPQVQRLGKYELISRLAAGGMAELWLACAHGIEGFSKHVVLKRILPEYASDEDFIRMFVNEARLAASLDHPNIAPVYDIGSAGGSYFFTMEFVQGRDLRQIVNAATAAHARIPLPQCLAFVIGTAAGLHYAHEKRGPQGEPLGIVHRDISPSNIVVRFDGGVKLVDFGIAKATSLPSTTESGVLKGKVAYMSPEQCRDGELDRRSDVFSLGVVLYELTTGRRPFTSRKHRELQQLIATRPVPAPSTFVPDYSPELERIVLRALHADRAQRYQDAEELQLALEDFARQHRLNISMSACARFMSGLFGDAAATGSGSYSAISARPQLGAEPGGEPGLTDWFANQVSIEVAPAAAEVAPSNVVALFPSLPSSSPPTAAPEPAPSEPVEEVEIEHVIAPAARRWRTLAVGAAVVVVAVGLVAAVGTLASPPPGPSDHATALTIALAVRDTLASATSTAPASRALLDTTVPVSPPPARAAAPVVAAPSRSRPIAHRSVVRSRLVSRGPSRAWNPDSALAPE